MVYFICWPDRSRIKIGTTVRLSKRLGQLASSSGLKLEVLAVVDGSFETERELHRRFSHLRLAGEWFESGDDLVGFIASDGKPWDGTDEADVTPKAKWPDEGLRRARRMAMARWRSQGWTAKQIAALFTFTAAYVRQELAELESGVSTGKAVCRPRNRRRLRDPEVRALRRRTMLDLKQSGLSSVEIAKFFSCTADSVRKELDTPEEFAVSLGGKAEAGEPEAEDAA